MKKTLALVLSVMMVLSLFAGMFSFTASAAEKGYAEAEADKLWAAADTVKATSITLTIAGKKVDIDAAVTNAKIADLFKDVEFIAEDKKETQSMKLSGSISFDGNGTLIIKGAAGNHTYKYESAPDYTKNELNINANGGLKIVLDGDFDGTVTNVNKYSKANPEMVPQTKADGTPLLNDDGTPVMKAVETIVPGKSPILVTSENGSNWFLKANGIGWDAGAIIVYGNITLTGDARAMNADGTVNETNGYDCIILRDNTGTYPEKGKGYPAIIAPVYGEFIGGGTGPIVENRSGDLIFSDGAVISIVNKGAQNGNSGLNQGALGYSLIIRDDAFVSVDVQLGDNNKSYWDTSAVYARGFSLDGTLVIKAVAAKGNQIPVGLNVQGSAINLNSGKLFVDVSLAEGNTESIRTYGIFAKDLTAFNLAGADVYVKVDNNAGNDSNAAITTQISGGKPAFDINMTAGKLTIDAGANSHAILMAINPSNFNITGGDLVVNGGKSFYYAGAQNTAINVGDAANVKITSPKGLGHDGVAVAVTGITLDGNAAAVTKGNAVAVSGTAPQLPAKPSKPNPPTSDFVVAPFVAVAMIAVVASAAIVLRKKVNG